MLFDAMTSQLLAPRAHSEEIRTFTCVCLLSGRVPLSLSHLVFAGVEPLKGRGKGGGVFMVYFWPQQQKRGSC